MFKMFLFIFLYLYVIILLYVDSKTFHRSTSREKSWASLFWRKRRIYCVIF